MGITAAVAAVAVSAVGTGVSIYGANKATEAQQNITAQEMKAEKLRKQSMELNARRETLQQIRNIQRTRALSLSTATSQNAQLGTGLLGAYGQTSGQGGFNLLGIAQGLQLGESMFGVNAAISQQRMALAGAQGLQATGQGLQSFGNSLMGSIAPIKSLSGGLSSPFGTAYVAPPTSSTNAIS